MRRPEERLASAMTRRALCLGVLAVMVAAPLQAGQAPSEIYVSTGSYGEVSFSDVAAPGAERLEVEVIEPAGDPLAEMERRIEQTLAVAKALEVSRLEREKARAEARARAAEARAEAAPGVIHQERYGAYPPLTGAFDRAFARSGFGFYKGRFDRGDRFDRRRHHGPDRADKPRHEPEDGGGRERSMSRTFLYDPD